MSVSAVGGSPAPSPYAAPAPDRAAGGTPREGSVRELTTVTTHCDQNHWHTPSCPHTVSTRPAPQPGEPGYYLDTRA